jgi:hypothetical protein
MVLFRARGLQDRLEMPGTIILLCDGCDRVFFEVRPGEPLRRF